MPLVITCLECHHKNSAYLLKCEECGATLPDVVHQVQEESFTTKAKEPREEEE